MAQETVTKFFVEHIQRWLDEEMKRDEQLAVKVQQSGKTAEQACNFVLSAKDRHGNRLETVEVNMKTWSIVQSRGLLNDPSERHDEIIELVKENMYKLKIA
jgi:hypothetical protein